MANPAFALVEDEALATGPEPALLDAVPPWLDLARDLAPADGFLGAFWLSAHIAVDAQISLIEIVVRETGDPERIRWVVGAVEALMRVRAALYDLRWRLDVRDASAPIDPEAPLAVYVTATHLWSRDLVRDLLELVESEAPADAREEARLDLAEGAEMFFYAALDPLYGDVTWAGEPLDDAARLHREVVLLCDAVGVDFGRNG